MVEHNHSAVLRRGSAWMGLLLLFALSAGCLFAMEPAAESPQEERPRLELDVVLNPQLSREQRADALTQLIAAADGGDGYAQYILGALYRLGDQHPAALVDTDHDKAARYLSNAAIRGWPVAMAGMAELRLLEGKALDALLWARLHIYYREVEATIRNIPLSSNRAYEASLLRRSQLNSAEHPSERIAADLSAFIDRHDTRIRQSMANRNSGGNGTGTEWSRVPAETHMLNLGWQRQRLSEPGYALYLIAINAQGRVARHRVVDSLPNQQVARALRRHVEQLRMQAVDEGQPLRWRLAPFEFDNQTVRLE